MARRKPLRFNPQPNPNGSPHCIAGRKRLLQPGAFFEGTRASRFADVQPRHARRIGRGPRVRATIASMDKFSAMKAFVRGVQAGTFTKAAETLDVPKAHVTRHVQSLEQELKTR